MVRISFREVKQERQKKNQHKKYRKINERRMKKKIEEKYHIQHHEMNPRLKRE